MQVTSLPLSGLPTPPGLSSRGQDAGSQNADSSLRRPAAHSGHPAARDAGQAPEPATRITLSTPADRQARAGGAFDGAPSAIYAEIWKDGVRIAAVLTNGTITPGLGLNWPPAVGNDLSVAQRRAHELAQAIGGEVRYAVHHERPNENPPSLTDPRTERMRAKLRAAYGL